MVQVIEYYICDDLLLFVNFSVTSKLTKDTHKKMFAIQVENHSIIYIVTTPFLPVKKVISFLCIYC